VCDEIPRTTCGAGTAACKTSQVQGAMTSLGVAGPPTFKDGSLSISYRPTASGLGVACSSNLDTVYTARIDFTCGNKGEVGQPVLSRIEGCAYVFTWESSAACPVRDAYGPVPGDCTVDDPATGAKLDLNPLFAGAAQGFEYKVSSVVRGKDANADADATQAFSFTDLCRASSSATLTYADGSGVDVAVALGAVNKTLTLRSSAEMALSINGQDTTGKLCPSSATGKLRTDILFTCNPAVVPGTGGPDLCTLEPQSCVVDCIWPTSLACPKEIRAGCLTEGT